MERRLIHFFCFVLIAVPELPHRQFICDRGSEQNFITTEEASAALDVSGADLDISDWELERSIREAHQDFEQPSDAQQNVVHSHAADTSEHAAGLDPLPASPMVLAVSPQINCCSGMGDPVLGGAGCLVEGLL